MEGDLKIFIIKGFLKANVFIEFRKQKRQETQLKPATFRSYLNSLGYNGFISYPLLIILC